MKPKSKRSYLDSQENRVKLRRYFYLSLVVLLGLDFLVDKHGHFSWENAPFFYAVYGFVACVSLIFVAKLLRFIVKRKEGYYE